MKRKREDGGMHSVTTNISSSPSEDASFLSKKLSDTSNYYSKTRDVALQKQSDSSLIPPSPCGTSITKSPVTPGRSLDSFTEEGRHGKTTLRYECAKQVLPKHFKFDEPEPLVSDTVSRKLPSQQNEVDAILMPPPSFIRRSASKSHGITEFRTPSSSIGDQDSQYTFQSLSIHSPSISSTCASECRELRNREQTSDSNSLHFYTPRKTPKSLEGHCTSTSTPSPKSRFSISSLPSSGKRNGRFAVSDRFIPSRLTSNLTFSVWGQDQKNESKHSLQSPSISNVPSNEDDPSSQDANRSNQASQPPMLNMLLRSELLGENLDPAHQMSSNNTFTTRSSITRNRRPFREKPTNFFRFNQDARQSYYDSVYGSPGEDPTAIVDSFSLSPLRMSYSQRLMSMPQKQKRNVSKVPFKVLDAPSLADDFYLNLVDWSSQNVLAVGLGHCVYLWSASNSKVTKLCDFGPTGQISVTSVAWTQKGTHLAVGVSNGEIHLWDTVKIAKVRTMTGHSARVGVLAWSGSTLTSGSRDRLICLRDVRSHHQYTVRLQSHKQEVCGLKWSFDEPLHLASGGNDNKLLVWDIKNHRQPTHKFSEHTAAVKAIAWSPYQHGLLASGGGTADRTIRFWNALSGTPLNHIDTGSQVCNLAWSKNCNEIVSTHGYSLNQIALWKYPTMEKVATLTGHTYRVLYLAMSPDGSTIVTGAGDETLRFWQVFPGPRSSNKNSGNTLLFPSSPYSILR
jgi:cell division cycle 20-like protein 1 (cofactor of APC complex)